jgi:hypothetical protein
MLPPPFPFFVGSTVTLREEPSRTGTVLAIKPRPGHQFDAPAGTHALYLPVEGLASVTAQPTDDRSSTLTFVGDLRGVRLDRPHTVSLAPVSTADADRVVGILNERYDLPRRPVDLRIEALDDRVAGSLVRVVGRYLPGHFEAPDFEGMKLDAPTELLRSLVSGGRFRVTAFYTPGRGPCVGYGGPLLRVVEIEEVQAGPG